MRLSERKVWTDIATYLMQFGKKEVIPGLEAKLTGSNVDPSMGEDSNSQTVAVLHAMTSKGMENEGRIAPELSSFGQKK